MYELYISLVLDGGGGYYYFLGLWGEEELIAVSPSAWICLIYTQYLLFC